MTPLEERLQQALNARAELITHETLSPARPPAPARRGPGRVAVTTAVLAAAATAAVVAGVAFTSLGRDTAASPAGQGGPTASVPTTTAPAPSTTPAVLPVPSTGGDRTSDRTVEQDGSASETSTTTSTRGAADGIAVRLRPDKVPAGSIAQFLGTCPLPGERGAVASEAFLKDADHDLDGIGAQVFTVGGKGTFAGSIAVEPATAPGTYVVSLYCGSTASGPDTQTKLTVTEPEPPNTDQDITLAAHAFYAGEWVAFSGVCTGGTTPASGWVISEGFEISVGHEYAGLGAVPFTADAQGRFVGSAHIPTDQPAGSYPVTVRCNGGVLAQDEAFDVLAPPG
jgi:hypothetical protein